MSKASKTSFKIISATVVALAVVLPSVSMAKTVSATVAHVTGPSKYSYAALIKVNNPELKSLKYSLNGHRVKRVHKLYYSGPGSGSLTTAAIVGLNGWRRGIMQHRLTVFEKDWKGSRLKRTFKLETPSKLNMLKMLNPRITDVQRQPPSCTGNCPLIVLEKVNVLLSPNVNLTNRPVTLLSSYSSIEAPPTQIPAFGQHMGWTLTFTGSPTSVGLLAFVEPEGSHPAELVVGDYAVRPYEM